MKAFFFATISATLFAGLSALAAPSETNPQFEIVSAKLAVDHGPFGGGKISIDYNDNTASLFIDRNTCPPGKYCTMEYRVNIDVTLPIVSVETDSCNIKTVIAKEDKRPVDGDLKQLTVLDFSQNTCPTFAEIIGKAEYLTSANQSSEGAPLEQVSTMSTKLVHQTVAPVLLEKTITAFFVRPEFQGTTSLQVLNDGTVQHVDNHGQAQVLSKLTSSQLLKIQSLISKLGDIKLSKDNGPLCMDAPTQSILAHRNGQTIELWAMSNCQQAKTNDAGAKDLVKIINSISSTSSKHE